MYQCKFSVAPMMGWSDRHCRFFHRQLSKQARLFTEMIVGESIIYGDQNRHLDFNESEHPIALQLGGSNPKTLARAAKIASKWHYDEINLNVGCPSSRVQSGAFGACLMRQPKLVGECVAELKQEVDVAVTVKCRLGVDEQSIEEPLSNFANEVFKNGGDGIWLHARKAILNGLNPSENRNIPPLNYERVVQLKKEFPKNFIGLNGGIESYEQMEKLKEKVDGFMVGRKAYESPEFLASIDEKIFAKQHKKINYEELAKAMMHYAKESKAPLSKIVQSMLGLFKGKKGAKKFRQILAQKSLHEPKNIAIIEEAFNYVLNQNKGDI